MSDDMEKNIKLNSNIQFFCDVTYSTIPPNKNKIKIFIKYYTLF